MIVESEIESTDTFIRNDMVHLSYNALLVNLKDQNFTLAYQLCQNGVFTANDGKEAGVLDEAANSLDKIITLSYSDYNFINSWGHDLHTLNIDRSELPNAVQDFYTLRVCGYNGTTDMHYYYLMQSILRNSNLDNIEPYDDTLGCEVTHYGNLAIIFYDRQNNPVGICKVAEPQNGVVEALCVTLTEDDFTPPQEMLDVIEQFDVPALTGGYSVVLKNGVSELTIDYDAITQVLPNATYYGLSVAEEPVMYDTLFIIE